MAEQTEGFSFLFSKLCELSFTNEASKGWDIYRRPRFTDQRRRALKRCLYETLFGKLKAPWIGNRLRFRENSESNIKSGFPFDVLNKFSIEAFQFRLASRFDDADKLDYYVNQWRNVPEPSSSVVNFNSPVAGNIVGCEAVLRFLIELAGSGEDTSMRVLGHQNDPWVKEQKKVNKMPLPEGPLLVTNFQLLHCQPSDFKHYVHYGRELFESTPILSIPGQGTSEVDQSGLEIFQATPGSFSGKAKFFASKTTDEDLHEKENRTSLFNALVHGHTTDLQVKLSLPDLPNGSKPFHSLAIEQREFTDDEGFESLETSSNSSTCSDQVTSTKETEDIWSIALRLPDQTFFTWETGRRRDLLHERPYLTEAGPAVFDEVYNTMIHRVSYLVKPLVNPRMVPLCVLIKDSINVLIGVPSGTFHLDKVSQSFSVSDQIRTTGISPEMLQNILSKLAAIGADYIQLNKFATHQRGQSAGRVLQSFLGALQNYLQCYRATVLSLEVSSVQSPFQLSFAFEDLGRQLRFLSNVCMCSQAFKKAPSDPKVKFPTGVKLLTYLYQLCLEHSTSKFYPILLSLLKHSAMPYIMFVQTWVFKGVCHDVFGEFMIEMDEQYLQFRDKNFWTHGFVMVGREKLDCVPLFLGELADDIFVCGKTINLLKLCCPEHYLCDPGIPPPKMEVTFSLKRLSRIEEECKQYKAEINKMHMQLEEQRENERASAEEEKQRAILEEREKAEKGLAEITALIQKAKDAVEQKKRDDFAFLKEQMEKALELKSLVKEQEKEAEIQLIKEMNERELTTAPGEEEIKRKAREDLIKYYEELSREVEHRQAQAQWSIRRRLLDTTRAQFLVQEQARLDSLREQVLRASHEETIDEPKKSSDKKHGRAGVGPRVSTAEMEVSTAVSVPSPSLVSLIASGVKTDAMLRAESRTIADGSSDSVDVAGASNPSGSWTYVSVDGTPHVASVGSSSTEAGPENTSRKTWDNPQQSIAQLEKLKEEGSGRRTWKTPRDGELTIASPTPKNHPSDSSVQFAIYGNKQMGNESDHSPETSVGVESSNAKTWNPSHSSVEDILYPRTTPAARSQLETQTLSLATQSSGSVTQPPHSDLGGLVTTQPSSSVMQESVFEGTSLMTTEPRMSSSLGHPSDSSAQHLLYGDNSQVGTPASRSLEYGHPSDSSLSEQLLYPANVDTPISVGHVHPYGHPSDSQVGFSSDGLDVAHVLLHRSRATWQHPSDASVQKLLTDISVLEDSQKTTRGIPPPSQAQNVLYPGLDASSSSAVSQTRGTPPLSVAQDIMYPSIDGSTQIPSALQSRGIPPPSVIQDIMYPTGELVVAPKVSSRGHEPAVKITKIMYYLRDKKDETESLVVKPKPLEFEDVWSASQVEPLRDNFDVLDERPLSNLLGSAMSGLPFTPDGSNDDDDTDAAQLMSLPVLLQKCVMGPLLAQLSLANSAITSYFIEDLQIIKHLDVFKKFLFLEDGEFSLSLSNQLFDKLAAGVSPREMCSVTVLNTIVSKALQLSVYSDDTSELAQKLAFALKSLPDIFKPNEIGTLDFLELRYKVDWPLNIVITEKSVVKYNKIFSFILRLKRLSWVLKDIWLHLKHVAYFGKAAGSPQIRQLHLFRHEMQHFVHNLEGYLSNQILNVTWCEFREALLRVNSLDDLHNQHAEYLRKAIFRSLLSRKASPVMAIISDLCTLILKLRTQLLASPWQQDGSLGHLTHPAFDVMSKTHKAFKEYSGFLLTVVGKLVRRGYQSHLDDFLLRINFNNFYNVE